MKKTIEIDLVCEDDIFEKYNRKLANKELINHIIHEADPFDKKEVLLVSIRNKTNVKKEKYLDIIKQSLEREYNKCVQEIDHNNIKQFIYLLIGIGFLFVSTIFGKNFVFEELFLIGGWVLIWETIEIEMFSDSELKKRLVILRKLLKSEFKEID